MYLENSLIHPYNSLSLVGGFGGREVRFYVNRSAHSFLRNVLTPGLSRYEDGVGGDAPSVLVPATP